MQLFPELELIVLKISMSFGAPSASVLSIPLNVNLWQVAAKVSCIGCVSPQDGYSGLS